MILGERVAEYNRLRKWVYSLMYPLNSADTDVFLRLTMLFYSPTIIALVELRT
jgi:hypothetical protein